VDYIVVGRTLGPEALGFYMLAFNISGWPINVFGTVISSVSLPGFSRLRLQGAQMSDQFVRALRFVAGLTIPVCFVIGALARPAVTALYGTRWSAAAPALVGLSVLGASRILLTLSADFLVSLGRTREMMLAQLPWLFSLTGLLILVAPKYGIAGVGAVQAFVAVAIMGPVYAWFLNKAGVNVSAAIRALISPTLWALLAAAGTAAVSSVISNDFVACVAGGLVGLTIAAVPFTPTIARQFSAFVRHGLVPKASHPPTDNAAQA
jgi:PST family polysaccharide transporter